jgi:hypothetical protein
MARAGFEKQDRVLRLLREVTLFQAVPFGLTSGQLAERMEINQRTAQCDIATSECEHRVLFIKHGVSSFAPSWTQGSSIVTESHVMKSTT